MSKKPVVLVVDDEIAFSDYISSILDSQDFQVLSTTSGMQALEILEYQKEICVVLLDIVMPEMNGFEVLKKIKNNKKTETIKVIMVSGTSEVEEKVKAFSLGAADYIEKPFASGELLVRVETQLKLKKAESDLILFKAIIESSKEAITISDSDDRLIYANPAYEKLFEISSCDIFEHDFRDRLTPDSLNIFNRQVCPNLQNGEGWEGELDVFSESGRQFPLWQRVGSIVDENHTVLFSFNFMHDISERKAIEEAWRKYTFMANTSKDLMVLINRAYIFEAVNDAFCQACGSSRENIIDKSIEQIRKDKFHTAVKEYVEECFSGKEVHYEDWYELNGKDKLCYDIAYYPYYDANNIITHAVIVSRDITERKKAEQTLRESQQFVQRIADTQPDILYIYDVKEQSVEFINHQVSRVLGFTKGCFSREKYDALIHPDDLARLLQQRDRLIHAYDKDIVDIEYRLVDKYGKWHWFYDRSTVFSRSHTDGPRQILGIAQDITTKKEIEKALGNYQIQLMRAEKMAAVGRLLAAIMHEINNPLQAVQSCLSLISEDIQVSSSMDKIKDYLDVASREVDRISDVILRSRSFYYPIQGKGQELDDDFYRDLDFEQVNLPELIKQVIKLVHKRLDENQISISLEISNDSPFIVQGHRDSLEQVFMNLLINSIDSMTSDCKKTNEGGKIIIKLSLESISSQLSGTAVNPAVRLEISDNGMGMSADVLERAFEPFFTTKENGCGLGLATCHKIIQAHEGIIEFESEPGMGTTVITLLPITQPGKATEYVA